MKNITDDCISRQAAIDEAEEWIEAVYCARGEQRERYAIKHVIAGIKALPSVQPEIIRCKDCKYYEWTGNRIPEEQTWWCYKYNTEMGNNDYCSYGERRDGDGNG